MNMDAHYQSDCQEKPFADIKDVRLFRHTCECGEAEEVFHYTGMKLNDSKSVEEFKAHMVELIRRIWVASYTQKLSPCIVKAVHEFIRAYKQTALPVDPVAQFYNFKLEVNSLPTWIILHSPSDFSDSDYPFSPHVSSQIGIRHSLLQTFLDEFTLTKAIRDELYSACATRGFNGFFSRVRRASLRELQQPSPETTVEEIGHGLRPPPANPLPETVTVVPSLHGFEMTWFVPDMLQRLEPGRVGVIGIEFVAKGQIWGMYIQPQGNQWNVLLCLLWPCRFQLPSRSLIGSLKISRNKRTKDPGCDSATVFQLQAFHNDDEVQILDLPVAGSMPKEPYAYLNIPSVSVNECRRFINNDGSCYLILELSSRDL